MSFKGHIRTLPITVAGAATVLENKLTVASSVPSCLTTFADSVSKNTVIDLHGGIELIAGGEVHSSFNDIDVTVGITKVLLVVTSGIDSVGSTTITGTSVDRNTGATTASDTEVIQINGVSTDNTSAGTELANLYDFEDAYISTKWWTGAVNMATSNLSFVADVYGVAFEQFNDTDGIIINTIDNTIYAASAASDFEMQAYKVAPKATPTANGCDLTPFGNMTLSSPTLGLYYRLRRGNLGISVDGASGEGVFCQAKVGNSNTYTNWNSKLWYSMPLSL